MALGTWVASAAAQAPQPPLNTLDEVSAALRACWVPPPLDQSRPGMQITVRMSFRRNGELFGHPRITFESAGGANADGRKRAGDKSRGDEILSAEVF